MKASLIILGIIAAMAAGVGNGSGATNEVSGLLQKGLFEEEANHDFDAAIRAYQAVVTQTDKDHKFAATAIFRLGECYRKQGKTNEANAEYQRILKEFPDQTELATLSRQQLGPTTGQAQSTPMNAGQIAEIRKLSPEKRRVAVQQMFPNPVLNALMQKMADIQEQVAVLRDRDERDFAKRKSSSPPNSVIAQAKVAPASEERLSKDVLLKSICDQIDDQVDMVLAGRSGGGDSTKGNLIEELDVPPRDVEESEIKKLQAMLRDSPDLLNIRVDTSGSSRLHDAARAGQLGVAKFLLDNGADVNARDKFRSTPLHLAVFGGRKDMVEMLLSRGAKVDVQTQDGKTPLHYAAERGFKSIAELLLARGAAVDAKISSGETAGETPLHEAAHAGNGAIAELLLANRADVNARDNNGGTPLYIAAEMGHPAVMELLIAHGADINATRLGMTPLMKAIAQNNTDAAKTLLQHEADIKIQMPKDSSAQASWAGWAALQFAVDKNNPEMVKLLLDKGADVNLKTQNGKTPLIAAVESKELEIAKLLFEHGADVNSRMAGNDPDKPRWTALDAAVSLNDDELVKLLLEHHADPNLTFNLPKQTETNATPLIMAAWSRYKETTRTLLANNADANMKNARGDTALWIFFNYGHDMYMMDMMELLLDNKANPDFKYNQGKTILHFAVEKGDTNLVKLFLAHDANVNARDDRGLTALHLAVMADSPPMVELLLAHGADVNAKNKEGNTPLDLVGSNPPSNAHTGRSPGVVYNEETEIRSVLRKHGGVAEVDIATIRVMRSGKLPPKIIFRKDPAAYNHFTLFELVANMYGEAPSVYDQEWLSFVYKPEAGLAFPDLSKLKVIHPGETGRTNVEMIDLEKALAEGECSRNISLKWGDIVEVPEMDHKITDVYKGMSQLVRDTLSKCLAREVEVIVKGQTTKLTLLPDLSNARAGGRVRADGPGNPSGPALHPPGFWLSDVVRGANVILTSSDLTRVRVKRAGEAKKMVFNLEKLEPISDLWLEDGDVIEIPEKNGE